MEQKFSAELFKKNVSALEPCPVLNFDYSKQSQGFQYLHHEVLSKVVEDENVSFDYLDMDAFSLGDLKAFASHMNDLAKMFDSNSRLIYFLNAISAACKAATFV